MERVTKTPLIDQSVLYPNNEIYKDKLTSLSQVDEHQLKLYQQQGFLAVENALEISELNHAINAFDDIIHKRLTGPKLMFDFDYLKNKNREINLNYTKEEDLKTPEERELALRKVWDYVDFDERLKAIVYKTEIIETVEKILGEKVKLIQNMALLKPPGGGGAEKPWHQDMAYGVLTYNKPAIGVWIALDEATIENGCMHVIPGSHSEGGIPHYSVRDWQICDKSVPVQREVVVPVKAGGLLLFHGMLIHGTPSNRSTTKRRAMQMHFVSETAEKIRPEEYKRIYTNQMSGAEC